MVRQGHRRSRAGQRSHAVGGPADDGRLACHQCGAPRQPQLRGRNAAFCSDRCRARWHATQRAVGLADLERVLARATKMVGALRRTGCQDMDDGRARRWQHDDEARPAGWIITL
jgi:endogenous inhibitor of DNA gyrase (YacG/DUF329 family)